MREKFIELLCCPVCRQNLQELKETKNTSSASKKGLICRNCQKIYKISNNVLDFLEPEEVREE